MQSMGHHANKHLGSTLHDNGVDFAVWAPFAKSVSLILATDQEDSTKFPLTADGDGYWTVKYIDAQAGQNYHYEITTQDDQILERNDPYARQLTDSDNGWSVIVSRDYEWGGAETIDTITPNKAVIYELHIGTFNRPDASTPGTFATAIDKLDYLTELGVNYVELMPVTSIGLSKGWGYAPNYLFSIENAYGGRRGLLDFVKACHEKGVGVILDVVYNHFYEETGLWQYDGWSENNNGGIYFYNDKERSHTPWGGRPDFGRPAVRQFILDNVAMWFSEFKIDGLRVDSTIYMRNTDGNNDKPELDIPEAWTLLGEINDLAHKINPNALMIAEDNSTNDGIVKPTQENGMGFDAQWEVGFPHVIRDSLGINENLTQPRLEGISYELGHTYRGDAFDKVIFADSHDTAANGSSRLNEAAAPGSGDNTFARHQTIIASALALTAPGIPMLLQGQEFMQEGAFNDWQMLDWDKTKKFAGIVTAHQHLINLRKNYYDNTRGLLGQYTKLIHRDDINNVIAFHRKDKGGLLDDTIVIVNFGENKFNEYEITFPSEGTWGVRFNSSWKGYSADFHETAFARTQADHSSKALVALSEYSVLILSKEAL